MACACTHEERERGHRGDGDAQVKCGPKCDRVKLGRVVVFTPGTMVPKFIEHHYCGKPVAVREDTLILRPMPPPDDDAATPPTKGQTP